MKKFGNLFLIALLSGATTLGAYKLIFEKNSRVETASEMATSDSGNYSKNVGFGADNVDFTVAADNTIHTVVHVKNVSRRTVSNPIFEFFYGAGSGQQQQEQVGTGSGVIISEDGYIVTNNHVIKDATDLEITLNNKKTYKAKLIGTDTKMDIALLKIETNEKLPYTTFADSDNVKVGEWVLAVGNPYNLTSTVTAGIVSAKARNLDTNGMQSFIQTDAAVNPGNSGGALVNTRGELIGINTMISSQTGSYVGYSFAVPSNITKKIIEDIMEFGNVQQGSLGVQGKELNGAFSRELGINETQGFYISKVFKNSNALKSGLNKGDIIVKLDNQKITTESELNGYVNTKRPNDRILVTFIRNNKTFSVPVVLAKNDFIVTEFKGIEFENLSNEDKQRFKIESGVKIKKLDNQNLNRYSNDLKGGVILSIGGVEATNVEVVSKIFSNLGSSQSIQMEMITVNGQLIRIIL
jgi:Do/DeqQ family serine protease